MRPIKVLRARSAARSGLGALGVVAFALLACASGDERVAASSSAIYGGTDSTAAENYVVLVHTAQLGDQSGIMVSPTLALMSAHGLVGGDTSTVNDWSTCHLGTTPPAADQVTVSVGVARSGTNVTKASRVFVDASQTTCTHDIAAVELATPVTGVTFLPMWLDGPPAVGTPVVAAGFGESSPDAGYSALRQRQEGVILTTDGGTVQAPSGKPLSLPTGFVAASVKICHGDSGSPLVDNKGNVVGTLTGIISTGQGVDNCADGVGVYVPLWHQTAFIERSYQAIGRMPWRVGKPPPSELGGACAQNNECHSNYCVEIGSRGICSTPCRNDADCGASGLACTDTGNGSKVCLDVPAAPTPKGCSAAPGIPSGGLLLAGAGFVATALARRRKRVGGVS